MYLIRTALSGTQFIIEFVKDQPNKAPVGIDMGQTSITGDAKVLTKFPIGTVFAVSDIKWGELASQVQGTPRPLFHEMNVLPGGTTNMPTEEDVDYTIDWMLGSVEFSRAVTLSYAAAFNEKGYHIDVETKINSFVVDESGTLRERIIRMYPCPIESEIGFHIDPEIWYLLIRNIMRGENTLLIGPTGSGKTELVSHISRAMKKPLSIQDMGTVQDAQSALLGVHRLNKDGHSDFDYAPFVGHVQREGIVLLDELNR